MMAMLTNRKIFRTALVLTLGLLGRGFSDTCPAEVEAAERAPIPVRPFIEAVTSSGRTPDQKLSQLRRLVGLEVAGQHRWYAPGKTTSERRSVNGAIAAIDTSPNAPEGVYVMTLLDLGKTARYLFSGTNTPSFPTLETRGVMTDLSLIADLHAAADHFVHRSDLLSVGLDTPPAVAAYKSGLREKGTIAFYGKHYPYYEFANFYEAPIVIDRQIWPTTEHYFQAMKFKGTSYEDQVRKAATPAEAARLGRDRSFPLRSDWEEVKEAVMMTALIAKFTQYPALTALLLSTGEAPLVEHTERDRYWGDGEDGSGKAVLGKQLVELRTALRAGKLPGHPFSIAAEMGMAFQYFQSGSEMEKRTADQIMRSDLSEIEKLDRLSLLKLAPQFFHYDTSELDSYYSAAPATAWVKHLNATYPEAFLLQLAQVSIEKSEGFVRAEPLRDLAMPHAEKLTLYRQVAETQFGRAAGYLAQEIPKLGLTPEEAQDLYFYSLRFQAEVEALAHFPKLWLTDAFIQKVVGALHEHRFPAQQWLTGQEARQWRTDVIQQLIEALASHRLHYRAVYRSDGAAVDTTWTGALRPADTIQLVLLSRE